MQPIIALTQVGRAIKRIIINDSRQTCILNTSSTNNICIQIQLKCGWCMQPCWERIKLTIFITNLMPLNVSPNGKTSHQTLNDICSVVWRHCLNLDESVSCQNLQII